MAMATPEQLLNQMRTRMVSRRLFYNEEVSTLTVLLTGMQCLRVHQESI